MQTPYPRYLLLIAVYSAVGAPCLHAQSLQGFGTCIPRAQRGADTVGCFIVAEHALGALDRALVFWNVDRFVNRAQAEAARQRDGTVIDAFGAVWLLTIGDSAWRSRSGQHVATIGPIPIKRGVAYSALYMEASMRPGMKSKVHNHSGAEVWYTLSGETCLETPNGRMVGRAGGAPVIVPGDTPMELTATGTSLRRSIVLILHDASRPPTTMETVWQPSGQCGRQHASK
jgi:quercetin dioxygenase-like cupin family protein